MATITKIIKSIPPKTPDLREAYLFTISPPEITVNFLDFSWIYKLKGELYGNIGLSKHPHAFKDPLYKIIDDFYLFVICVYFSLVPKSIHFPE